MSFLKDEGWLGLAGNAVYPRFEGEIIDIQLELQFCGMLEAVVKG